MSGRPRVNAKANANKAITATWQPDLCYDWDNGPAISRYLAELKQGRLIGKHCRKCSRILLPPRMFCELCWRPTDEWVYVQDTGTVNTSASPTWTGPPTG